VYARCINGAGPKQACVIPIDQEFQQIFRDILLEESSAKCNEGMASACDHITGAERDAIQYRRDSQRCLALAKYGLRKFETGETGLDIDLPPSQEKLISPGRRKLEKAKIKAREEQQAKVRAMAEAEKYANKWVKIRDREELLFRFKLSQEIFSPSNIEENERKKVFKSRNGWCLNYDKGARYYTVTDDKDRYVALDGSVSADGKAQKFHFMILG
jgi:hypothetical protein